MIHLLLYSLPTNLHEKNGLNSLYGNPAFAAALHRHVEKLAHGELSDGQQC